MKPPRTFTLVVGAALLLGSLATRTHAAAMILHNFTGGASDGQNPFGCSLTLSGSKIYGMTRFGGDANRGVVFSMNTDGTGFSLLQSFKSGPSLTNGGWPYGSITLSGSKLFGMTNLGGSTGNGAVFTMNTDGTGFGLLHSFTGSPNDGWNPRGDLTLAGSKLYGMTLVGGENGSGAIFSMNTDGTGYILLHSFTGSASDGSQPYGSLTLSGSTLYGMTKLGGSSTNGTLFRMNTDGTGFGLLHSFTNGFNDGINPTGSLTLSGSTLYGMASGGGPGGGGVLFNIGTDGSGFRMLESFGAAPADGRGPLGDLTLSGDGSTLYGMTSGGGTASQGVIFSRAIPEPGAFTLLSLATLFVAVRRARPV